VATTAPARGAAAISICSCHSLRGSSTTSIRSIRRSVCLALAACFSEVALMCARMFLSGSLFWLRTALRTPLAIQLRCIRARPSRPALVSAYSSYSSRACRRATSRSTR
jgi:hypothetical protein